MADYVNIKTWVSKNWSERWFWSGLFCNGDVLYPCPLPKIKHACFSGLMLAYNMGAERNHNSETISLWEGNSKKNIWAHKRKLNMESQNQWRIRQADKT